MKVSSEPAKMPGSDSGNVTRMNAWPISHVPTSAPMIAKGIDSANGP
jgi:hypothetical protein